MSLHGMMVLCIGTEAVTVPIGPDGAPEEAPHICPDCVMSVLADAPPLPDLASTRGVSELIFAAPQGTEPRRAPRTASARAPPVHLL